MRPTARALSMRDVALASLLGVLPGSDFGVESAKFSPGKGAPQFGGHPLQFGYDPLQFGDDAASTTAATAMIAAAGPRHPMHPQNPANQAVMMQMWNNSLAQQADTAKRRKIINPNEGSDIKINVFSFSVNQALTLGTALGNINVSGTPQTNLRPQRVTANAPQPGFVTLTDIKVANVSVLVGGIADAFEYSALAQDSELDMPMLTPSNPATVTGSYTGYTPPGFVIGTPYPFTVSFKGPATMTA